MRVARRGGSCLLGASSPGIQGPFWLELSSQQTDLGIVTHPSGRVAEVVGPRRSGPYPVVHDRRPAGVAPEGLGLPTPRPAEPASWKLPSLCSCSEAQHHGGASPHSRQTLRLWERNSMAAPRVKTGAVHLFSVDAPVLSVDSGRYGLPKYFK